MIQASPYGLLQKAILIVAPGLCPLHLDRICTQNGPLHVMYRKQTVVRHRTSPAIHLHVRLRLTALRVRKIQAKRERRTYHAAGVIPKGHATGVHHPIIGVTNTLDPKSFGLCPGCGHIAKDYIYQSLVLEFLPWHIRRTCCSSSTLRFEVMCWVPVEVLLQRALIFSIWAQRARWSRPRHMWLFHKSLHLVLYSWGEEVALDSRYASGRLCRNNVNANYATIWWGSVKSDLWSCRVSGIADGYLKGRVSEPETKNLVRNPGHFSCYWLL